MDEYGYPYSPSFSQMGPPQGRFPGRADDYADYYGMGPMHGKTHARPSTSKQTRIRDKHSRSRSSSSKSRSRTRSRSRSRSRSRTNRSRSRSISGSRNRGLQKRKSSILDAFRVLYLTPSGHRKSTTKYLTTTKRQSSVQEVLKSDGLGSKRWLFYPKTPVRSVSYTTPSAETRKSDQRVKFDAEFFRHYKKRGKVDSDSPIAKLKPWELILYSKLGFVQAV